MSYTKFLIIIALFASVIWAFAPLNQSFPQQIRHLRPRDDSAVFTTTSEIPGGEVFGQRPCNVRIDPLSGKVGMLIGNGLPIEGYDFVNSQNADAAAIAFVNSCEEFTGVDASNLMVECSDWLRGRAYIYLKQLNGDIPVWGGGVSLMITPDARVSFYRSDLVQDIENPVTVIFDEERALNLAMDYIKSTDEPERIDRKGIWLYPAYDRSGFQTYTTHVFEIYTLEPLGLWQVMVDVTDGHIVRCANEMRAFDVEGTISGKYHPEFMDDPLETGTWFYARVWVNSFYDDADIAGNWIRTTSESAPWSFNTSHSGLYCEITNDGGAEASYSGNFSDNPYDFTWTESMSPTDQMNLYYHTNRMHNYVRDTLHYSSMNYQMDATVNWSGADDNACWDGSGINFGGGASVFNDMALFSDVIYHEYTHGVTHHIYPGSTLPYEDQSGAIDEALSDYYPCSMNGDPFMGDGGLYVGGTTYMRRVNGTKVYPDDFVGEVHADGEIISAPWWCIKEEIGRAETDSLIHHTRFTLANDFEDFFWATLATDDDDGDIYNGTPNGRLIYECYYLHGIGPGFTLEVNHRPLKNTEQTTGDYNIQATFHATLGITEDSAFTYWRVDDGAWNSLPMSSHFGIYRANIPAQPLGSNIDYYIYCCDNGGNPLASPSDAPVRYHSFCVTTDSTGPVVTALPVGAWFEYAWPPQITVNASDDHGIQDVFVEGRIGDTDLTPSELIESDTWDIWVGDLPGFPEGNDTVEYWISATDISSSHHETIYPSGGVFTTPVLPGYNEDIEASNRGLHTYSVKTGYSSDWRRTGNNNPFSAGSHCYQFNTSSGEYSDQSDGVLSTPRLRLGSIATLTFWHRMSAETDSYHSGYAWDGGIIEVSTDGGENWMQVNSTPGYNYLITENPASPFDEDTPCFSGFFNWRQETIDLSPYAPYAMFRFHFGSDAHVTDEGWYIDDIVLETDLAGIESEQATKPQNLSIGAYPNPFNASISIEYNVPQGSNAKLDIHDLSGRIVMSRNIEGGRGTILWDGKTHNQQALASGIYFARLRVKNKATTEKIILLK